MSESESESDQYWQPLPRDDWVTSKSFPQTKQVKLMMKQFYLNYNTMLATFTEGEWFENFAPFESPFKNDISRG